MNLSSRLQISRRRTALSWSRDIPLSLSSTTSPRALKVSREVEVFQEPCRLRGLSLLPSVVYQEFEELEVSRVKLKSCLLPGESSIDGFEHHKRLFASDVVALDLNVAIAFLQNHDLIPDGWGERTSGNFIQRIFFDGSSVVSRANPGFLNPCLFASGDKFEMSFYPAYLPRHAWDLSAVLEV